MPIDWKMFSFIPDLEKLDPSESFVAHLPAGIFDEGAMFDALARAVHFPDYFGKNWNAVLDCLRDLTWIQQRDVILVHADVPSLARKAWTAILMY